MYLIINFCFILILFSPSKIGGFERGRIEDSLDISIRILAILLTQNDKYIDVLTKIFSRNPTYYAGKSFNQSINHSINIYLFIQINY